jgi:hypothetical protein
VARLGQARLPLQYVERLRQAVPGPGSPGT